MRLTDLQPHWVNLPMAANGVRFYIGVSFLCPHCVHGPCPTCGAQRGKRLAVSFWPPIDPDGLEGKMTPVPHETFHGRVGDTFETLTLDPSFRFEGHFHGSIINGEVIG